MTSTAQARFSQLPTALQTLLIGTIRDEITGRYHQTACLQEPDWWQVVREANPVFCSLSCENPCVVLHEESRAELCRCIRAHLGRN